MGPTGGVAIRLTSDGDREELFELGAINQVLALAGAKVWPQDWSGLPPEAIAFLADPDPSPERVEEMKSAFLLSRERLLELIADAGRAPHVPGGGELVTTDATHGVTYPQLYVARKESDFSRFDRMHVNRAEDGTPVDDVVQLLCGSGLVVAIQLPEGEVVTLSLGCPDAETGWLLTVDCAIPFIGSFSGASIGTKALSQVIGPRSWQMEYLEAR